MKALIDGDILVYRCGFAAEHMHYRVYLEGEEDYGYIAIFSSKKDCDAYIAERYPDGGVVIEPHLVVEPMENALSNVKNTIEAILDNTKATKYVIYLTGEDNYRNDLVDYYKANRKDARKPKWYQEIRDYLVDHWGAEVVNGIEADDAMGIAQIKGLQWIDDGLAISSYVEGHPDVAWACDLEGDTTICTLDKDLNMIPGWHYNWVKQQQYWVTEDEATNFYYTQLCTGDSTDNIAGIPKCGPVKARKILEGKTGELELYAAVLAEYTKVYKDLGEEKLIENANLLWILREEGQLWTPPK